MRAGLIRRARARDHSRVTTRARSRSTSRSIASYLAVDVVYDDAVLAHGAHTAIVTKRGDAEEGVIGVRRQERRAHR